MSYQSIYILAAFVIIAAIGIVQFAQHLPATLERHAAPAEFAIGAKDDQPGQ